MNYVLLNQGTPESKCAAVYLSRIVAENDEIHSLFLDFGMPNKEPSMVAAQRIAEEYCTTHGVMNAQMIVEGIKITPTYFDLLTAEYVPGEFISEEKKSSGTYSRLMHYPFYRHKAILEAMAYARIVANATIVVEVHGGIDEQQMADINKVFNSLKPPAQPTYPIEVILPFMGMELIDILESLDLTYADIEHTISCAETLPCGICSRCIKMEELKNAQEKLD